MGTALGERITFLTLSNLRESPVRQLKGDDRASEREFSGGFQRCSIAERNNIDGDAEMTKPSP